MGFDPFLVGFNRGKSYGFLDEKKIPAVTAHSSWVGIFLGKVSQPSSDGVRRVPLVRGGVGLSGGMRGL